MCVFSTQRYLCVALICLGLVVFSLKKSAAANKKLSEPNLVTGYALVAVNLAFDGFTNAYQVRHTFQLFLPPLHTLSLSFALRSEKTKRMSEEAAK